MDSKRSNNITAGLILILLGVIFFLNTLGLFSWNIWGQIWKLWPLILVILGIKKILEK